MRTPAEIHAAIAAIEADERMGYEPANVFINAPLALIQTEGEAAVRALKWALGEIENPAGSYKA